MLNTKRNVILPFGTPIKIFIVFSLIIILPLFCVPAIFLIVYAFKNSVTLIILGILIICLSFILVGMLIKTEIIDKVYNISGINLVANTNTLI